MFENHESVDINMIKFDGQAHLILWKFKHEDLASWDRRHWKKIALLIAQGILIRISGAWLR